MSYFGKPRIFGEPLGLLLMRGGAGAAPELLTTPGIDATRAYAGTELLGVAGTYTGADTVTHQWQRRTTGAEDTWGDISGATSLNYTPVDADAGADLRRVETATNGSGSTVTPTAKIFTAWWVVTGLAESAARAVYQGIGQTSLANAYKNLITPGTKDIIPGAEAPLFSTADGIGNNFATAKIATTGIDDADPSTDTIIARFTMNPPDTDRGNLCGFFHATSNFGIRTRPEFDLISARIGTSDTTIAGDVNSGVLAGHATRLFANESVNVIAPTVASVADTVKTLGIGSTPLQGYLKAHAVFNTQLADATYLLVYAALQRLDEYSNPS